MSPELTGPTDWDGIRAQALANSDWKRRYDELARAATELLDAMEATSCGVLVTDTKRVGGILMPDDRMVEAESALRALLGLPNIQPEGE